MTKVYHSFFIKQSELIKLACRESFLMVRSKKILKSRSILLPITVCYGILLIVTLYTIVFERILRNEDSPHLSIVR